jgi:PAS domain S-box-containing protein
MSAQQHVSRDPVLAKGWSAYLWSAPVHAAIIVFVAYYSGTKLGFALTSPPNPIAVLWPPNAILFAALLLVPPSRWWAVVIGALAAHLFAQLQGGVPVYMVCCWFVSNLSEALIGALCVRRLIRQELDFDKLDHVLRFSFAAVVASFFSSFLDSAFVTLVGWGQSSYWELWRSRFISNVLASVALVPAIVGWFAGGRSPVLRWTRERTIEATVLVVGIIATTVLAFDSRVLGSQSPALLYLPFPFLLWAALRFGPAATSTLFVFVSFFVIWVTVNGIGPFGLQSSPENVWSVRMFLLCVAPSLLLTSALFAERKTVTQALRRSERRFARAFQSSPNPMFIMSPADGRILDVNARWEALLEHSADQAIGRTVDDLGLYVRAADRAYINEMSGKGSIDYLEIPIRTRSGAVRHAAVSAETIVMDGERWLIASINDITDRKHAEEALRLSDQRFHLVLEATHDVVYDRELATNASWWSGNGLKQFGYSHDNAHDRNWIDLIHPDDRGRVSEQVNAAIETRATHWELDYRLRRADETHAYVHEHGLIVRDSAGRAVRVVGALTDVTESRHRDELEQRLAHASRLTAMGELTASIAHEINQPISAILSNVDAAEMLLERAMPTVAELPEVLNDIRNDALRASEVIRHVRGLSTKQQLRIEQYDPIELVNSVVRLVAPRAQRRKVRLTTEFANMPAVRGDRIHMQQVLLNVLLNSMDAIDETREGSGEISIRTSRLKDGIEIAVSDTGQGLLEDQRNRIFESFYTTKKDGMGLGLSIAQSLVVAHGGRIWAENNVPRGAVVRFTVPVDPFNSPARISCVDTGVE